MTKAEQELTRIASKGAKLMNVELTKSKLEKSLVDFYLSYINEYLTREAMAEDYDLPLHIVSLSIEHGRELHEKSL